MLNQTASFPAPGAIFGWPERGGGAPAWDLAFGRPERVWSATTPEAVPGLLAAAGAEAATGRWVAVLLAYEAAAAFDPAFATHWQGAAATGMPLAWAASFAAPLPAGAPLLPADNESAAPGPALPWEPMVSRDAYEAAIARTRRYIEAGDFYQINYTMPFRNRFAGDALAWYGRLRKAQQAAWCAWLDLGRFKVLSLSPELFFEKRGPLIATKPMKGTMPRGRWAEEDATRIAALAACPKNRAENIMIVDLLRNDLGRVAVPGSVRVPALCEVERYPAMLQMTSTVTAALPAGTGAGEVLGALFPCGSITGAPKIRAMQVINELEPWPRRVYTGAIGLLAPGGAAAFNVAIRTVILDTAADEAIFGVGGGITWDSTAGGEYDECLVKMRFLQAAAAPAWRLLESLLLEDGAYFLLDGHLRRLGASAAHFGFAYDEARVRAALAGVAQRHSAGAWKVRLLHGRDGETELQAAPLVPAVADSATPCRVALAAAPVDADDVFLCHKTTSRGVYDRHLAAHPDCADVLLWNSRGELTEACLANVVVELDGDGLLTPPRSCGLLAGVFREELLRRGELRERVIRVEDLRRAKSLHLINSVRRWRQAVLAV